MAEYELVDAEVRALENPSAFAIPDRQARDAIAPGQLVKLIFRGDEIGSERMWVEVEKRVPGGGYIGRLDNEPVVVDLELDDEVRFGPEHIIEIHDGGSVSVSMH